jgi:hypothetical protein
MIKCRNDISDHNWISLLAYITLAPLGWGQGGWGKGWHWENGKREKLHTRYIVYSLVYDG